MSSFCGKCGTPAQPTEKFCGHCGTPLVAKNPTEKKKSIIIGAGIGAVFVVWVGIIAAIVGSGNKYYFDVDDKRGDNGESNEIAKSPTEKTPGQQPSGGSSSGSGSSSGGSSSGSSSSSSSGTTTKKGKYQTAVVWDTQYSNVKLSSLSDVNTLIKDESNKQKANCPSEIQSIENDIMNKYAVTAVNLCEIDLSLAKEIERVFGKVYAEFPAARGTLTNFTIANGGKNFGTAIAAFMPIFQFATADSETGFPWGLKMHVALNAPYYLNLERLQDAVRNGSASGHFPKNTTPTSPVAHEFGHYLSFLSAMKTYGVSPFTYTASSSELSKISQVVNAWGGDTYSLDLITEAYNNFKRDTGKQIAFDDWRGTISQYALAKRDTGEYIYDETIAEGYHDTYLNGDQAAEASKYVVAVLKERLNK